MRGLIAGVLGGAARGYTQMAEGELKKQQELDLRTQLMEAETEKQLRIDEIKRNRDQAEETRKMSPEYLTQVGAAELTKGQIAARNRKTLAPETAAAEAAELEAGAANVKRGAEIKGIAEATGYSAKVGSPGYLTNKAREARAGHIEPASSAASAAATNWKLGQEKAVADLRKQLSALPKDDPRRAAINQQIQDLTGGVAAKGETLAQQVAAARAVLGDLDSSDEQKTVARDFLDRVLADAASKRGAQTATGVTREGQESVSKSGKPIVFRNGQWVYK